MGLAGEPLLPSIASMYGDKPSKEWSASEIAANNIAKREYQKEYMEYWNSTQDATGTGRPVDALSRSFPILPYIYEKVILIPICTVVMPLAPFAAARPRTYRYYGYTSIVNILDYAACAMPVTLASKDIDFVDKDFKPANDTDKSVAELREFSSTLSSPEESHSYIDDPDIYDGAHVGVQVVGRRLQEEKVLALAEYLGDAVRSEPGQAKM